MKHRLRHRYGKFHSHKAWSHPRTKREKAMLASARAALKNEFDYTHEEAKKVLAMAGLKK